MSAAPVLVTGGAGYIGSHTTLCLLQAGFDVVVLDNLSNSSPESLRRVAELAGRAPVFVEADLRDRQALENVFSHYRPASVVHFAGLKAVGESVEQPLRYYENNVQGSLALFEAMQAHDCAQLVFSSSATVYGDPGDTLELTNEEGVIVEQAGTITDSSGETLVVYEFYSGVEMIGVLAVDDDVAVSGAMTPV